MSGMNAAIFNPAKMMYNPYFGMDYSSYLGSYPGGINYGNYIGSFGGFGCNFGNNVNPVGNKLAGKSDYTPGKYFVEDLSISNATLDLQNRIRSNQSTRIANSWERYKNAIKNTREYKIMEASGDFTEGQILSHIMNKYAQTSGVDIRAELLNNTHGNFISGIFNGATFGIARDKSSDEWNKELFGVEPPRGAALKKHLGTGIGAAATTATIFSGAKLVGKKTACNALKPLTKNKIAGIALAAAILSAGISAFSDVTN